MRTRTCWTVANVLAEQPCLSEAVIRQHFGNRRSLTLRQILDLPRLSAEHKIWMACRPRALPPALRQRWMVRIATRAVERYALPHSATHRWAQRWIGGADRSEAAAWAAARAAAWAAERAAGAAWAAAWAAGDAAGDAWDAWAAAGVAEYDAQVADLRALLDARS